MKIKHKLAYMEEYGVINLFEYSEESPSKLVWNKDRGISIKIGDFAGWRDKKTGYFREKINGKCYQAHRIVFAIFNKNEIHSIKIDHINRNRADNTRINLRKSDNFGNARNKSKYRNNTSGFNGISLREGKRYVVQWYENGALRSKSFFYKEIWTRFSAQYGKNLSGTTRITL